MARPSGWSVLGLDVDPTPGVVESVQALAKEFGDFAHDVQSAWSALNSFGGDATALSWIGQSADAFKSSFGSLPGRLHKLYVSYSEASDALSAYWPKLQAAQGKADAALRHGQDADADVTRAGSSASTAAAGLKTAQAGTDPKALSDAQAAHDAAHKNLSDAKGRLAALATDAHQAHADLAAAAAECAKALHHASHDGIHNKHWWQHVGEVLSEVGGKISEWAGEIGQIAAMLAPILNILAVVTAEIPGLDVITITLAAADDLIAETAPEVAAAGLAMKGAGDLMQGHYKDAFMDGAMFAASRMGGKGKGSEPGEDGVPPGAMAAHGGESPGGISDPAFEHGPLGDDFAPGVHDPNGEFEPKERDLADRLADGEGWRVDQRAADHTVQNHANPDTMIRKSAEDPGKTVEFKTLNSGSANAVKRNINDASGKQAENGGEVVIDGRKVGLTREDADRGYARAVGQPGGSVADVVHVVLGDDSLVTYEKGK